MHSGKRPLALLLALAASLCAVAAIAGCGGGDGEEQALASTTPAKSEYAKRAEAICAKGRMRALRYQPALGREGQTAAASAHAIEVSVLPAIQGVVDDLYALGAPAGERSKVEEFLAAFQEDVSEGEDLEVPTFERIQRVFATSGEMALKMGIPACVYGQRQPLYG